jgi:dihydroflavonol-4-reductase
MIYPGNVLGPDASKPTGQHIKNLIKGNVRFRAFEKVVTTYVYVMDIAEAIVRALEKEDNLGEKYLLGKYQLSQREYDELIGQISGNRISRLRLPDNMAILSSVLLTGLANLAKRAPLWGISGDGLKTAKAGLMFDGSKAERELGISYTPIHTALEKAIAFCKE